MKMILILHKRCLITVSEFADSKMSLALFTICLISGMYGSEAVGRQCKISERSFPGKALKGHTFKEFAVRAIVLLFSLPFLRLPRRLLESFLENLNKRKSTSKRLFMP